MFDKILWALIRANITFGPLFMTRIAGTATNSGSDHIVIIGVLMLSLGLGGMFRVMQKQQKNIRSLQERLDTL